jgi:peptidoglycan/xylan/chitin deacetylase (PgdA/CDA1 family)
MRCGTVARVLAVAAVSLGLAGCVGPVNESAPDGGFSYSRPSSAPVLALPVTATEAPATTTTRLLPQAPAPTPVAVPAAGPAPEYRRVPTLDHVVFLTIDDGMVRDPAVLDFLEANHIPFSAFPTMGPVNEDPAFWQRVQSIGGTIEGHTLNHPDLFKTSAAQMRQEVCGPLDPFQTTFGRRPTLFRPPFGNSNAAVRSTARQCGYRAVVLWMGSTNNGKLTMQEPGPLKPGDIILMHWRKDLLDNLHDVVARCQQDGFTIARLEDYLSPDPVAPPARGTG